MLISIKIEFLQYLYRDSNPTSLLVQLLIRPLGIQLGQPVRQAVVLAHKNGVDCRQDRLLAAPGVPRLKAEPGPSLALCILGCLRQEILAYKD